MRLHTELKKNQQNKQQTIRIARISSTSHQAALRREANTVFGGLYAYCKHKRELPWKIQSMFNLNI